METKLIKIVSDVLGEEEEEEKPKVKQPIKFKTKEEKYQELLANQINIIETKINEYDFLSQHRHKNHPSLLNLSIDIINEKKKLKEIMGSSTKKEKIKEETKEETKENIDKEKIKTKKEKEINDSIIFKYDQKIVEKEFQNKYQKPLTLKNKSSSSSIPIVNNKSSSNSISIVNNKSISSSIPIVNNKSIKKPNLFNCIPRYENNVQNNVKNNVLINKNDIKIVDVNPDFLLLEYPLDEEEVPIPEKKVKVNESCNLNISIPITNINENNENNDQNEIKCDQIEIKCENNDTVKNYQTDYDNKHIKTKNKSKTMINTNKFKKQPFKREEKNSKQWESIKYNIDIDNIPLHLQLQPIKLTQKKIKDFLVKEKITNNSNNLPSGLANFLYSSIKANDFHINFVDILNE